VIGRAEKKKKLFLRLILLKLSRNKERKEYKQTLKKERKGG
jgi:hypothetical protein